MIEYCRIIANHIVKPYIDRSSGYAMVSKADAELILGADREAKRECDPIRKHLYYWNVVDYLCGGVECLGDGCER